MIEQRLRELARRAWELYDDASINPCVVRSSIPIVAYGDVARYMRSDIRIVTVAKNPGAQAFGVPQREKYFPGVDWTNPNTLRQDDFGPYLEVLARYFSANHKKRSKWFVSFEELLGCLDASYYGDCDRTALHTDLLSPLATEPNWSKLPKGEQVRLASGGVQLWHQTIEALAPDIVVISASFQSHAKDVRFKCASGEWESYGFDAFGRWFELPKCKPTLFVFGPNNVRPFMIGFAEKKLVADRILSVFATQSTS